MVNVITEWMVNPFDTEQGTPAEIKQPLVNFATSTVAIEEITDSLCFVRKKGGEELTMFVNERLALQVLSVILENPGG